MLVLENDTLKVSFSERGAELRSMIDKKTNHELMWSADATYWGRVSPTLFPIVGRLIEGEYVYDDAAYSMGAHGYLRDKEMRIKETTLNSVTYEYESDEGDYANYPFKNRVEICYTLDGSTLQVAWTVTNMDTKTMYYSIGGHPAFALDTETNYVVKVESDTLIGQYLLDGSFIAAKQMLDEKSVQIPVNTENFLDTTFVYENIQKVILENTVDGSGVEVACSDFQYLGLWSASKEGHIAPFVCIEPWNGLPDTIDSSGEIEEKLGIIKLEKGESDRHAYTITIR